VRAKDHKRDAPVGEEAAAVGIIGGTAIERDDARQFLRQKNCLRPVADVRDQGRVRGQRIARFKRTQHGSSRLCVVRKPIEGGQLAGGTEEGLGGGARGGDPARQQYGRSRHTQYKDQQGMELPRSSRLRVSRSRQLTTEVVTTVVTTLPRGSVVVVCLSGRGDKDAMEAKRLLGDKLGGGA